MATARKMARKDNKLAKKMANKFWQQAHSIARVCRAFVDKHQAELRKTAQETFTVLMIETFIEHKIPRSQIMKLNEFIKNLHDSLLQKYLTVDAILRDVVYSSDKEFSPITWRDYVLHGTDGNELSKALTGSGKTTIREATVDTTEGMTRAVCYVDIAEPNYNSSELVLMLALRDFLGYGKVRVSRIINGIRAKLSYTPERLLEAFVRVRDKDLFEDDVMSHYERHKNYFRLMLREPNIDMDYYLTRTATCERYRKEASA